MTTVKRQVNRETAATIYDRGKHRPVIVSIEPPNLVGFRLKGTQRTYRLPSDALFMIAIKAEAKSQAAVTRRR